MLYNDNFSTAKKSAAKVYFFTIRSEKNRKYLNSGERVPRRLCCGEFQYYLFPEFLCNMILKVVPLFISDSLMKILPLW
jgi:hypothetical protein